MPILRRTGKFLGNINTSKLLTITSNNEVFWKIESGNVAAEANAITRFTVFYGESNVIVNSGGVLVGNGSKFWDSVVGNFSMYFSVRSSGVTAQVMIHEYAGN